MIQDESEKINGYRLYRNGRNLIFILSAVALSFENFE